MAWACATRNLQVSLVDAGDVQHRGEMADQILRAGEILLWFWFQYGPTYRSADGVIYLDHMAMGAGEDAAEFLVELGLCIGTTRSCGITTKGLQLMGLKDCTGYDEFLTRNPSEP